MRSILSWFTLALALTSAACAVPTAFTIHGKAVTLDTVVRGGKTYVDLLAFASALKLNLDPRGGSTITLNNRAYAPVSDLAALAKLTVTSKSGGFVVTAPATQTVQGTTQLRGDAATFGTTYTIGKQRPINFTLRSAEFTVERINHGPRHVAPAADEKLLVLHFTLHNPRQEDVILAPGAQPGLPAFTVVDARDVTHEGSPVLAREGTAEPLSMTLKPAQKIDVYTVVVVPAGGPVPKLIVDPGDGAGVLRYDLRGKVTPLKAPVASPADSGVSALTTVRAAVGQALALGAFDAQVTAVQSTREPLLEGLNGETLEGDQRYLVVTLVLRNRSSEEQPLDTSYFFTDLQLDGGERLAYPHQFLQASRAAWAGGMLRSGQEVTVRVPFAVPTSTQAAVFGIKEDLGGTRFSRTYLISLPGSR